MRYPGEATHNRPRKLDAIGHANCSQRSCTTSPIGRDTQHRQDLPVLAAPTSKTMLGMTQNPNFSGEESPPVYFFRDVSHNSARKMPT